MNWLRAFLQRCIWAYVAGRDAWDLYPQDTTVIPNTALRPFIRLTGMTGPLVQGVMEDER